MPVTVHGADRLRTLARQLREAGDASLRKELHAGLSRAVKPLKTEVVGAVAAYLPSRYAALVAASLTVRTSARGGQGARVRVTTGSKGRKEKRDLSALNAGVLRHPVFGRHRFVTARRGAAHRDVRSARPWVAQRVQKGFFDDQAVRLGVDVARECERVIDQVARKIEGGT